MKRIFTLLLFIMGLGLYTQAQITLPYAEDLESEPLGDDDCNDQQVFTVINWSNSVTDDLDWNIWTGTTTSTNTGPTSNGGADHNPGIAGGKYMFVETSSPCNAGNLRADLISDEVYTTGTEPNLFFSFWYHQYGDDLQYINVETRIVTAGVPGPWVTLDSLYTAPPGFDGWQESSNSISSLIGDTFQIKISGLTGAGFESDYALDDFSIFSIFPNDAGITAIDGPSSPAPGGINNVAVSVTNFGADNLLNAIVNWEFNGAPQTPYAYTAPFTGLPTGSSEGGVVIGTANVTPGIFTVKAWTTLPNGVIDSSNANDTSFVTGCGGALRGSYTLGGPSADFADFTTLGFVLSTCGIDSHTVINVNPGVYNERLILTSVPGTADTATLTIDGGDAATTTIRNGLFSNIYLNGTDYTTIKNLRLECTGTTDNYGVQLRDSASFNTIDSCVIAMDDSTTNLQDVCGVNSSDSETFDTGEESNAYFTTVSNCLITGGEQGIHYEGDFGNRNVGNSAINNILIGQEDYGIYVDEQDSLTLVGNTISGMRSAFGDGMLLFDIMMFNISENNVEAPDYGINIEDGNFDAIPTSRGKIINNMITSSSDRGLDLDDVSETDIFHNTVAVTTTIATNGAFYVNDLTDCDIRNNIFYCEGSFAVYSLDDLVALGNNTLDYNIYFTTGPNLIDAGPTVHVDLASWQAAQGTLNASSLQIDPLFLGGFSDLHLFDPNLDDLGDNTVGVVTDIDGEVRPQGTNVDIGADEFTPLQDDAGVSAIENPNSPASVGLNDVIVAITNYGADTLESATIEWELDGVLQTPYAHTDSLLSGDTRNGVVIGSTTVAGGVFFNIKAWTVLPNGVADIQNANDTTEINGCGALRGSYTVGGAGADFPDLTTLGNVLSSCGIDSTTIININPGIYNERLILARVPGTNDTTTLTINGGSVDSVTISNDVFSNIYLDGTDYTTIKNITLECTGTVDNYGVQLRDSASFNTIDSCVIAMDDSTTNLFDVCGVNSSDSETTDAGEESNAYFTTVSNCLITGGEQGIHYEGDFGNRNVGNSAINNILIGQEDYGIYVDEQDSLTIVGNTISGLRSAFGDGMLLLDIMMFNISENNVQAPDYGINIEDGNFDAVPTSRGKIINNMISSSSDRALDLDDVEETDIWHNTIAASVTGNNGAFYTNDLINVDIRNNIFYGEGSYAWYSLDDLTIGGNTIDYNVYFTTGTDLIDAPLVYTDLLAWQTAQPGFNTNSIEGDPVFVGGLADLHLVGAAANDVGDMTLGITVDIDGDARPEGPIVDIGADEYTPSANDAEAVSFVAPESNCGDNITEVKVIIRNLGQIPITSLPITVNYAGTSSGTLNFTYTGTLAFGEFDTVTVGSVNTFNGGTWSVDGFVNLALDEDLSNDTFPSIPAITFTPAVPQGVNGITCGLDSAVISAVPYPGAGYEWFASNSPLDTVPVGIGNSYTIPSVAAQDTYYLGYANNADSLSTGFPGGNGSGGNMFDVVALNPVSITNFAMNMNTGTSDFEIFYKAGTFVGFENNPGAWTSLGTAIGVTNAGPGLPTQIPISFTLSIPAGQTYAFYIAVLSGATNIYTNGATVGNVWASNSDLEILEGFGNTVGGFGNGTFSPRNFNGNIYYGSTACSNARTPVTAITTPGVSVDLGNDTVICGGSLDLDAGTNADFYAWSTSDTTQLITASTTGQYSVEVSDSVGCEATDTFNLTVNSLPLVSAGSDTTLCGNSYTAMAMVGSSVDVLWSNADTTAMTTVTASGTYTVVATDTFGCQNSDSVEVNLNLLPVVDLGNDTTVCGGLELNAENAGADYLWNTGEIDRAIIVNSTDVYDVVVTDSLGCEGVDTIDVTILPDATYDTAAVVCGAFTWVDGNTYINDTIVDYVLVGSAANGCDSVITLDLDVTIVDTAVTQSGVNLSANAVGVSYQWVDCDNGNAPIAGATSQDFTPTANGNYAVQITDNGCTQTSTCVNVTGLSIRGFGDASLMDLYPNPTENMVTIDFGSVMKDAGVRVLTLEGKVMQIHEAVDGKLFNLSLANYPAGLYFVEVESAEGTITSLKLSKF